MRALPLIVKLCSFSVFVYVNNISQDEFTLKVMAGIGYLTIMTHPTITLAHC
jgi:hypothetical protein